MSQSAVVRGSINIDEFYSVPHVVNPGETLSSTGYTRRLGGKGANQAIAISKAGAKVSLDAAVGFDGDSLLSELKTAGVDVTAVKTVEGPSGRAVIQSSADGENSIVLLKGANFAQQESSLASSFTHLALQNEVPLESTIAYLHLAKTQNVTTFFNPSPMPSKDELRVFPWNEVDWLLVNQGEAVTISEAFAPATANETAESTLQRLRKDERFAKVNLVCTLGASGVIVSEASGRTTHHPAARLQNPLKDTTGAGDCFTGYFVAGLMRLGAEGLDEVVKECLTACSICVESAGAAESIPSRDQVLQRIRA